MICQNIEWFACPPPLLRTSVRMSSGSALRLPRISCSGFAAQSRALRRRGVEVVDVGRMVAVVMDLHRLGVDVRLVLVCRVGQGIEPEGSRRRLGVSRADDARGRDRAKAGENVTTVQHRFLPWDKGGP